MRSADLPDNVERGVAALRAYLIDRHQAGQLYYRSETGLVDGHVDLEAMARAVLKAISREPVTVRMGGEEKR